MTLPFLLLLLLAGPAGAATFGPARLEHVAAFPSAHVDASEVSAWLPVYCQARIDRLSAARGRRQGRDLISRNVPGAAHNERAWRARPDVPLRFLLVRSGTGG